MAIRRGRFGYSFIVVRILQFLCFAGVAGLCIVLAAEVNRLDAPHQPPPVTLALVVSVIAAAYTIVAVLWHVCGALPYVAIAAVDAVVTVLLIVTSVLIGRPLTRLDCSVVGDRNEHIESLGDVLYSVEGNPDGVHMFIADAKDKFKKIFNVGGLESVSGLDALGKTEEEVRSKLADYAQWVGRVEGTCRTMKAVWSLSMILIFLFVATAVLSYILYRRVNSIRTFHVEENADGSHSYYTQHVPAAVMRETSFSDDGRDPHETYEGRPSTEDSEHRPIMAGKTREAL